jgi:hypothetical protein
MYYHGMGRKGYQLSRIARSQDGITFTPLDERILSTYLRRFEFEGSYYLLGMPGVLYRSDAATGPFEPRSRLLFDPDMRHAGLRLEGDSLPVFWSRAVDEPERILLSTVDLSPADWNRWKTTEPIEVMRPERGWEGSELSVLPSLRGEMSVAANELRDPFVFEDRDGRLFLYYTGSGEQAIGVATLHTENPQSAAR